jgi:hypothetical protein
MVYGRAIVRCSGYSGKYQQAWLLKLLHEMILEKDRLKEKGCNKRDRSAVRCHQYGFKRAVP